MVVIEFGVFLKKNFDTDLYLISITDSPDKPEGPLEVGNITPDSCVLTWNAPKVSAILSFQCTCFTVLQLEKFYLEKKKTKENFDSHLKALKTSLILIKNNSLDCNFH